MRRRSARHVACTCGWWRLVLLGSPAEGVEDGWVDGWARFAGQGLLRSRATAALQGNSSSQPPAHVPVAIVVVEGWWGKGGGGEGW